MSYADGFNTGLGGLSYLSQQIDAGQQRRRQQEGDQMVRQRFDQEQQDRQSQNQHQGQQDGVQRLGRIAAYLAAIPDPQSRAAAYAQVLPQASALGQQLGLPPLPQVWSEDHLPELQQLAAMGGQAGGASGVQGTFVDAQGNRVAIMRDGSTQIVGQNAPNMRPIQGQGGFYGYDPRTNTAAPTMVGGGQPQMPQQGPQPGTRAVQFDFAPGTPPEVIQATQTIAGAEGPYQQVQGGQQLQPKPAGSGNAYNTLSAQEVARLGLPPGTVAQRDSSGKVDVISKPDPATRLSQTQLRQANAAKQKLIDLKSVRNQLALVRQKFQPLQNSWSAGGFGQGMIPSVEGKQFDASVSLLTQFIRKLTRTPGEGAMSDWEGKLALLANPSRGDYEAVTADKLDQLDALLNQLEQGYGTLLDDNSPQGQQSQPAPAQGDYSHLWSR